MIFFNYFFFLNFHFVSLNILQVFNGHPSDLFFPLAHLHTYLSIYLPQTHGCNVHEPRLKNKKWCEGKTMFML